MASLSTLFSMGSTIHQNLTQTLKLYLYISFLIHQPASFTYFFLPLRFPQITWILALLLSYLLQLMSLQFILSS